MSKNENTLKIQEEINRLLGSELREQAMGFVDYLRENDLTTQLWFGPAYWRVLYGTKYLCGIILDNNRWRFWFWKGDYSGKCNENFSKAVHDHVRPCISCVGDDPKCPKGKDMTVFDKEFSNTCFQFPVQFENPDNDTLEHIKALLAYWKDVNPPDDAWHAHVN